MARREGPGATPAALLSGLAAVLSAFTLLLDASPAISARWGAVARAALSPACHQIAERSFSIDGHALVACTRCVGLHASGVVAGLVMLAFGARLAALRGVLAVAVIACWGSLALDVAAGMAFGWDHPWLRFATGLLAGTSVLSWGAASLLPPRVPGLAPAAA